MFCPRCGQQQSNQQIRFCSRCRFLLAGMHKIVANGGITADLVQSDAEGAVSPKIRGVKQGGIMLLSGMIVVPLLGILSEMLAMDPVLAGVAAVLLFWGGILRMIYALIFQSGKKTSPEKAGFVDSLRQNFLGSTKTSNVLPPYREPASSEFQPGHMNWRDTTDLEAVTDDENATRSLHER